jgi:TonB family protein
METVVQTPAEELHLLTEWGDPAGRTRMGRAAVLSVLAHIAALVLVLLLPESFLETPQPRPNLTRVTPLIEPLTVLTQKDPVEGKVNKQFNATEIQPRPRIHIPPAPPAAPPPQRAAVMPPAPKPLPPPPLPEPPKVEITNQAPRLTLPVAPPQIQAEEKRATGFEDVTPPRQVPPDQRIVPIPGPSTENALRGALHSRGANDPGAQASSPHSAELPQLLSDPQGVDFRPYLAQVLAMVKRNWYANMPEVVKLGRTARVALQFAIQRDGSVRKIVYAEQTSVSMLDNAAVAAISQSNPFPALPPAFRGPEIRVQVNFAYNVPKQ